MSLKDKTCGSEHMTIEHLDARRGKIYSSTGGWFPGKGVFSHGYSMLEELVGEKSYFQILILNATGRLVSRELADWVEACFGCLSWPDPRIWCNQVGALAGTARTSVIAAASLGSLANESKAYGAYTFLAGVSFIQGALKQHKGGASAVEIVNGAVSRKGGKPAIMGYFRPIAKGDERIEVLERVSQKLGLEDGEHLTLAYDIEEVLMSNYDEGMNLNGYVSAFLSDHGFSGSDIYQIFALCVSSGVVACYLDTAQRPPGDFLPLRCEDIDYQGNIKRSVPDVGSG